MAFAEDRSFYSYKLVRPAEDGYEIADDGFDLVRTSHFIKEVLAVPPQAMSYSGFRIGMTGVYQALVEDPNSVLEADSAEALEAALKERGVTPQTALRAAGARGTAAHLVLELLADGERQDAEVEYTREKMDWGTHYGEAVITFWDECVQPYIDNGEIEEVLSEHRVTYLAQGRQMGWVGTFDLGLRWAQGYWPDGTMRPAGWEILDLKTHKPARGFTKEGQGAGYVSDAAQIRAYRMGFEDDGNPRPIGQRTIVARENGKYLEDSREVSEEFVLRLRAAYNDRMQFEKGVA